MTKPIGTWLSAPDGDAYAEYCRSLGLDESALATLLLAREVHADQLRMLKTQTSPLRCKDKRVTIRPRRPGFREEFRQHASANGLSLEEAAALLLVTETREKWLENVLTGGTKS